MAHAHDKDVNQAMDDLIRLGKSDKLVEKIYQFDGVLKVAHAHCKELFEQSEIEKGNIKVN